MITFSEEKWWQFLHERQGGVTVVITQGVPPLRPASLVIVTQEDVPEATILGDVGAVSGIQVEVGDMPEISNWCFHLDEFEEKYHKEYRTHFSNNCTKYWTRVSYKHVIRASLENTMIWILWILIHSWDRYACMTSLYLLIYFEDNKVVFKKYNYRFNPMLQDLRQFLMV